MSKVFKRKLLNKQHLAVIKNTSSVCLFFQLSSLPDFELQALKNYSLENSLKIALLSGKQLKNYFIGDFIPLKYLIQGPCYYCYGNQGQLRDLIKIISYIKKNLVTTNYILLAIKYGNSIIPLNNLNKLKELEQVSNIEINVNFILKQLYYKQLFQLKFHYLSLFQKINNNIKIYANNKSISEKK